MQTFQTKVAPEVLLVMGVVLFINLGIVTQLLRAGGLVGLGVSCIVLLIGAGLPLWLFLSTQYVIDGNELRITSGPFRWTIPLSSISSIAETRSRLAAPAFSLDRIDIRYGNGKRVMVSPEKKQQFLAAIDPNQDFT